MYVNTCVAVPNGGAGLAGDLSLSGAVSVGFVVVVATEDTVLLVLATGLLTVEDMPVERGIADTPVCLTAVLLTGKAETLGWTELFPVPPVPEGSAAKDAPEITLFFLSTAVPYVAG